MNEVFLGPKLSVLTKFVSFHLINEQNLLHHMNIADTYNRVKVGPSFLKLIAQHLKKAASNLVLSHRLLRNINQYMSIKKYHSHSFNKKYHLMTRQDWW
jgi:hypothetical protein